MMRTGCIYDKSTRAEGTRILITRHHPRGVKKSRYDVWYRDLAPSRELLSRWKRSEINWDSFKASLMEEYAANPKVTEILRQLAVESRDKDITLLCFERRGEPCHRYIIEDLVNNVGVSD